MFHFQQPALPQTVTKTFKPIFHAVHFVICMIPDFKQTENSVSKFPNSAVLINHEFWPVADRTGFIQSWPLVMHRNPDNFYASTIFTLW